MSYHQGQHQQQTYHQQTSNHETHSQPQTQVQGNAGNKQPQNSDQQWQQKQMFFNKQNLNKILNQDDQFQEVLVQQNKFTITKQNYSISCNIERVNNFGFSPQDKIQILIKNYHKKNRSVQIYKANIMHNSLDILSSGLSLHQLFQHMKLPTSLRLNIHTAQKTNSSTPNSSASTRAPLFGSKSNDLFEKSDNSTLPTSSYLGIVYQANINKKIIQIQVKIKLSQQLNVSQTQATKHFNELNSKVEKFKNDKKIDKIRDFYEQMQQAYQQEIAILKQKLKEERNKNKHQN